MEGRCEDFKTSPSPFSSAVSPPHEVDGLFQIRSLPGICYCAKLNYPQPCPPRY